MVEQREVGHEHAQRLRAERQARFNEIMRMVLALFERQPDLPPDWLAEVIGCTEGRVAGFIRNLNTGAGHTLIVEITINRAVRYRRTVSGAEAYRRLTAQANA